MSPDTVVTILTSTLIAIGVLFLGYLRWERWRKRH